LPAEPKPIGSAGNLFIFKQIIFWCLPFLQFCINEGYVCCLFLKEICYEVVQEDFSKEV
jgi:hypothetical protein